MSIALYTKYRPGEWDEVVGQEHITVPLRNALKGKMVAHAYLFSGPRGTGKTSVARILAREAGSSPNDIHEIDAASNRGIDEIRALREEVRTLPFESPIKSYVIDEVHMLTKDAWNALLKTLEEPPAHVMFVLATTELHKVPDTIISRCQTYVFRKPTHEILRALALRVAKKEGIKLDEESATLIALLGDGSFRDTHGILQKAISAGEGNVTGEYLAKMLGAPRSVLLHKFIHALIDKNADSAVSALGEARREHIDMKVFLTLALRLVRLGLLSRVAPAEAKEALLGASAEEVLFVSELGKKAEPALLAGVLREFLMAHDEMDSAHMPELPLELAVFRVVHN